MAGLRENDSITGVLEEAHFTCSVLEQALIRPFALLSPVAAQARGLCRLVPEPQPREEAETEGAPRLMLGSGGATGVAASGCGGARRAIMPPQFQLVVWWAASAVHGNMRMVYWLPTGQVWSSTSQAWFSTTQAWFSTFKLGSLQINPGLPLLL